MDEETKKILDDYEERIKKLESLLSANKSIISEVSNPGIWDIEGNILTVIKTLGDKSGDRTQNTALLVLMGYREMLKQDKVLASEIKRNVALNKVPIENFGTYINELIPQSILRIGKTKSNKLAYKLTPFGYARAKELMSNLLKNE